jgi:hypothetical protein
MASRFYTLRSGAGAIETIGNTGTLGSLQKVSSVGSGITEDTIPR